MVTRRIQLLQSIKVANAKKSVLIDDLSELVSSEELDYSKIDRTTKSIEVLTRASGILAREAGQPYIF